MKKEEAIRAIGSPILRPLGLIQGVLILGLISSPFLWMWVGWTPAWKTAVSCTFAVTVIGYVYRHVEKAIAAEWDRQEAEDLQALLRRTEMPKRSKFKEFQEHLAKIEKSRNASKN